MTTNMNTIKIDAAELSFTVPPECQGQIVEVAYASDGDLGVIRRTTDRSDGSVSYEVARWDDIYDGLDDDTEITIEPWNRAPSIDEGAWVEAAPR